MSQTKNNISILGCGNIGSAIAFGLIESESIKPKNITVTRRNNSHSSKFTNLGINFTTNNRDAVKNSDVIIIAVTPQQLKDLIEEIKDVIDSKRHYIFSVVSGATIKQIKNLFSNDIPVVRVMPNTAIAIRESMTCISGDASDKATIEKANQMFGELGKCVIIQEDLMIPATALCACGIAFFLRAIRAASQGGIEIGFHAEEALFMAAQTAKGAASMLVDKNNHPEREVDKVTTPQGCTISGLNQMEHSGFSSSLIKGIVTSAQKAETLYSNKK